MRGVLIKNVMLTVSVLAIVAYLLVPIRTKWSTAAPDVTVLQFWHPWTGEYADALNEVIAEFNRRHPKIRAVPLFMPTGAGESMKFFSSVAGGVPPDVIVVDGTQVASWADLGVLQPLGERLSAAGVGEDDFWEPSWRQCRYNGKTWAISAAADPNFILVWNKHLFRQAGLDPERPPRTIKELEKYALKLTRYDAAGRVEQLGFMPTYVPHGSIAVLTWGWAFGGEFYNDDTQEFTCDDPNAVAGLEWIVHMDEQYGGMSKLGSFQSTFGLSASDPFNVGKLAMNISYISLTQQIAKFAPNLEYGMAPLPRKEGVEPGPEWIGGWTMALPYGERGNEDEAFELIRWMCADPYGSRYMARRMKLLPAYKKSPFFEKDVPGDPILEMYMEILARAKHIRPITPANAQYMTELLRALGRARTKDMSPREALEEARRRVEKEWAKIQKRTKAKHTLKEG